MALTVIRCTVTTRIDIIQIDNLTQVNRRQLMHSNMGCCEINLRTECPFFRWLSLHSDKSRHHLLKVFTYYVYMELS